MLKNGTEQAEPLSIALADKTGLELKIYLIIHGSLKNISSYPAIGQNQKSRSYPKFHPKNLENLTQISDTSPKANILEVTTVQKFHTLCCA